MLTLSGPVTTEQDRSERMDRVVWHIEENLPFDLSLERLADVACYSTEHFHRMFCRTFGETPQSFVHRVRLENAANYLMYCPLRSISEIAAESGFSTPAYFSTAFRKHFGVAPQVWKRVAYRGHNQFWEHPSAFADLPDDSRARKIVLTYRTFPEPVKDLEGVEVRSMPAERVAVLRSAGGYTFAAVRGTWLALQQWAQRRGLWKGARQRFGVLRSNPLVSGKKQCLYYAAVSVPDSVEPEGAVRVYTVPENLYALYRHRNTSRALDEEALVSVYLRFYHRWMRTAGMEPFHLRSVEIMPETLPLLSWRGAEITLGIPVRPARLFGPPA
jgi:AraC family transcriptional regulator